MFFHVLHSEWTKLRSTRSLWWTTALIIVLSCGWSAAFSSFGDQMAVDSSVLLQGFFAFSVSVVVVQAAMVITTEFRYDIVSINFLATPHRWMVMVAKLVVYSIIAALATFIAVLGAYITHEIVAAEPNKLDLFHNDAALRYLWAVPIAMPVLIMFVHGIALLVRQTAGAVSLSLIWYLGFESTLGLLPVVGDRIVEFTPNTHFTAFLNGQTPAEWVSSSWISLIIFFCWAVTLWGIGLVITEKRDA